MTYFNSVEIVNSYLKFQDSTYVSTRIMLRAIINALLILCVSLKDTINLDAHMPIVHKIDYVLHFR